MSTLSKVWAALASLFKHSSVEQAWCFIEYVPSSLGDVMREVGVPSQARRWVEDAGCAQPIDDAVVQAKALGARLLAYVEPEHLLFIFGETAQALGHAQIALPEVVGCTNLGKHPAPGLDSQNSHTGEQAHPNSCAVVFCHILDAQDLAQFKGAKKQENKDQGSCYEVLWGELEGLKKVLDGVYRHGAPLAILSAAIVAEGGAA